MFLGVYPWWVTESCKTEKLLYCKSLYTLQWSSLWPLKHGMQQQVLHVSIQSFITE